MDEEKLIIISYQDEILDSFVKLWSDIACDNYMAQNQLKIIDILDFCAFTQINVEFK